MRKTLTSKVLLLMMLVLYSLSMKAQVVTIGTGTTTSYLNPLYSCYGYSYSQQIYTAAEILAANGGVAPNGQIVNLRFHLNASSNNSGAANSNQWTVYLGNTTQNVFTSAAASYVPAASMTQVFSGVVTFPSFGNWVNIPLAVPFTWDGTSNIVVAVDENTPSWDCTMYWTSTSTSPNNRSIYYYNDNTNPNPASPPSPSGISTTRANVQFQWAMPCNTASGYPTTGTVAASPAAICVSGNVSMSFTPTGTMPSVVGLTYKWQSCPTATGTFVDIPGAVTSVPNYTTTTPITTTTYYKCVVLCNGTSTILTSAASNAAVVNNPGTPVVAGATRCGPGSLTLTATPPTGTTTNWYTAPSGGVPIATGNTYTTPVIPTTTTYYAAASSGSSAANAWVGTGTTATTNPSPIYTLYYAQRSQFVITAAEMIAAGFGAGTINSLAIDVVANAGPPLTSFTIKMGSTSLNAITSLQTSPATQVYTTASYVPVANSTNTFVFPTPYVWDGVSNLLIETCFNNSTWYTGHTVKASPTSYSSSFVVYDDVATFCANPTTGYSASYNSRPNFKFDMTLGCNGPRQAVVATITAGPALSIAQPATVCSGEIANIAVSSSPMSNYANYVWTPSVADLYTNAAATTPYVSGSAPNVYFKSSVNGAHTYYLFSSGTTAAACTRADTISIWVQPDSVTILGMPDTICVTGTTALSLSPATGYAPNSVQWEVSTDSLNYTPIAGATNPTYTTPVLTTQRWYRAKVKSTNNTCEIPVKHVVIADPQLLGVVDSFNCGPGTVTLGAITGGNGSAIWYDVPTGGAPVGYGVPFVTPALSASTNFYVSATGGTTLGTKVLGAGALTSGTQTYNPFCSGWGGTKIQYLVRASELIAAGIPAGSALTSIGVDVVAAGSAAPGFAISMKNTASTVLTTAYESGTTTVFPAQNINPTANALNNYIFTTPFQWDGTSNVLIQMCWSNGTTNTTPGNTVKGDATTFVATHRGQSDSQTPAGMCGVATASSNATYSNRPKFTFGYRARCETPRQVVHANIYPKPVVDLGPDVNMCVDAGTSIVLDAGVQPNTPSFLWDNNTTSQVRAVNGSGTYNVKVTNGYTCVGSDTVHVQLRRNPVVELGNDTTVCNGVTLALDAGDDGIEYFWNTGQPGQSIDVNAAGSYSVFVTNSEGCVTMDTIQITMQGELPTIQGIQVSNDGNSTFHFTAVYPQNVIGYDWDFGDGSLHSYEAAPHHTYENNGDYVVVLHLSSTCGFANDTSSAHIVGIRQINVTHDELTVYPNPSNGQATIWNKGALKMEKIEVYSMLGQVVYRSAADSKDKHVISLDNIASGIYTIEIYTDKGTVARKLEIIK